MGGPPWPPLDEEALHPGRGRTAHTGVPLLAIEPLLQVTSRWHMSEDYVELHARSAFSFLEGASLPEELISVCTDLNGKAMALLDRDGLYGSPRFHMAAKKRGIKAHIGAEITVALSAQRSALSTLPLLVES